MKTQKFKILSLRMALLTILLSGLSMQNIYAFSETTKNLPLNGRWEVKARSLSPIPTASYDSQSIYIENPSPNCDITITITSKDRRRSVSPNLLRVTNSLYGNPNRKSYFWTIYAANGQ